jgi:hypothetical protein
VPAGGRVPELRLGLGLGSFAFVTGMLSKIVWIKATCSYDRRCSPIFLDDDSSYDGLLMADFDDHQRPSSDSNLQFLEVDVSTAAI